VSGHSAAEKTGNLTHATARQYLSALLASEWVILGLWRKILRGKTELFHVLQIGYDFSMAKLRRRRTLRDAYRFPGFVPAMIVHGMFGSPLTRVVSLKRRQKKQPAASVASGTAVTTTASLRWCETYPVAAWTSTWSWKCGGWTVEAAAK
jgi:hypothetical protein